MENLLALMNMVEHRWWHSGNYLIQFVCDNIQILQLFLIWSPGLISLSSWVEERTGSSQKNWENQFDLNVSIIIVLHLNEKHPCISYIFQLFFWWLGQKTFLKDGPSCWSFFKFFHLGSSQPHQTGGSWTSVHPIITLSASIWAVLVSHCFMERHVCVYTCSDTKPRRPHSNWDAWLLWCSHWCWEKTAMSFVWRRAPAAPELWMDVLRSTRESNQIL